MPIVKFIFKIAQTCRKKYWKLFNIKTRGVRVILIKENKVLLVRHRYNDLWVFPGGNIKKHEDFYSAAKREVCEETGYRIHEFELYLGTYKNTTGGKDDKVTVLTTTDFSYRNASGILRLIEVRNAAWFDASSLPKGVSEATERRLSEYFSGKRNLEGVW